MKSKIALGITLFSVLSTIQPLFADSLVITGSVASFAKDEGIVTILSDKNRAPVQYTGMNKAVVQFVSGKPATLADVALGQQVTVEYAVANNKTVVSKILLPDAVVLPAGTAVTSATALTPAEQRAATSKAAHDNDITTQPGSKAKIDGDITTQPGSKALIDKDRTTQPGNSALQAPDITKKQAQ